MTKRSPINAAFLPDSIEFGAEARADSAFLDHGELGGKRARPEQNGEIVRLLHAEIAADLAGAAQDRLADDWRGDHLVVEHDGEWQADILLGHQGEALGAGGVEAEGHHRLAGALIEAGLRVDQVLATDQDRALKHIGDLRRPLRRAARRTAIDQLVADRDLFGLGDLRRVDRGVDQLELELAGLADQLLQPLDVLDAGHLHEHAVTSLALDAGLGRAERIDAPPDGLDRGLNGGAHAVRQPGVGDDQRNVIVTLAGHVQVVAGEAREHVATDRLGELAQFLERLVHVGSVTDLHRDLARSDVLAEIGIADAGLAQSLAHVAANGREPVAGHLLLIELIEEMSAALQVEAEIDLLMWQPGRHARHRGRGEQVGKRKQDTGDDDAQYQDQLPSLEMQHEALKLQSG